MAGLHLHPPPLDWRLMTTYPVRERPQYRESRLVPGSQFAPRLLPLPHGEPFIHQNKPQAGGPPGDPQTAAGAGVEGPGVILLLKGSP